MSSKTYEIRECTHCGLRFPVVDRGSQFIRCPACLGLTQLISKNYLAHGNNLLDRVELLEGHQAVLGVLDNIRSALNVGAIFRTADGLGFEHLYLCGITPTPENPEVIKTGLGAQNSISWSNHRNGLELVQSIKAEGAGIIVLENMNDAISIDAFLAEDFIRFTKLVLVVGNEITGVDPAIIDLADSCMRITMHGFKRSFNVSIAFAIAAFVIASKSKPWKINNSSERRYYR